MGADQNSMEKNQFRNEERGEDRVRWRGGITVELQGMGVTGRCKGQRQLEKTRALQKKKKQQQHSFG